MVTLNRNPQVAGAFVSIWALQGDGWHPVGAQQAPALWAETDNFNMRAWSFATVSISALVVNWRGMPGFGSMAGMGAGVKSAAMVSMALGRQGGPG